MNDSIGQKFHLVMVIMDRLRIMFKIYVLFSVFLSTAHAFNWRKCTSQHLGGSIFGISTSSGQFTSSTGGCSALGMNKKDQKKLFYYASIDQLQNDIAKGSGENLSSLLILSGCTEINDLHVRRQLKENFEAIFNKDVEQSYNYISPFLDSYCKSDGRG